MSAEEISRAIRQRRQFLHLTQFDLAEMSGITVRTIHLIESGSGNPSIKIIGKIAVVLGMELTLQVKTS